MAGPITLTKPQFLATAAGKRPGSSYQNYLAYIAKRRQSPVGGIASDHGFLNAPPADPYNAIIGGLPQPLSQQQIQTQAQGEISPLVAAAAKQIGLQTQNASNAIRGYSSDAAAKLAAMDFGAPYAGAETSQAAVDAALRQSLAGAGSSDADQLAQRLAVLNDPSVAQAAHSVSANGAANGNTALVSGSAALSNLLANAAAAKNYGQKLPGITQLAGLQQIASAQQQGQNNLATQTQQYESQLPSIIQALLGQNDQRAQAVTAAKENQVARQDAISATSANNAAKVTTAKIAADAKASAAQVSQARSDRTYRLQFAKTFGYDPVTGRTLPGYTVNAAGQVVKTAAAKKAKQPQLSAFERQKFSGTAATIASNGLNGFTDAKGTEHPAISWQEALVEMDKAGVPRPIALQAINKYYPVETGTPSSSFPSLANSAGK